MSTIESNGPVVPRWQAEAAVPGTYAWARKVGDSWLAQGFAYWSGEYWVEREGGSTGPITLGPKESAKLDALNVPLPVLLTIESASPLLFYLNGRRGATLAEAVFHPITEERK